jgi:ATP-binding protein involved in chromosome partitioning
VWRGPMLTKMLKQFLEQVDWGNLDYLILDLPPGTGDVQISLAQMIPLSGAVIVTTPQDVALADVRRAVKMLKMTQVPILGVVENMSGFECPHCHERSAIFGGSPDKSKYASLEAEFLGELPLELSTRVAGDEGQPIVVREPDSKQAERFRVIARRLIAHPLLKEASQELEMPVLH